MLRYNTLAPQTKLDHSSLHPLTYMCTCTCTCTCRNISAYSYNIHVPIYVIINILLKSDIPQEQSCTRSNRVLHIVLLLNYLTLSLLTIPLLWGKQCYKINISYTCVLIFSCLRQFSPHDSKFGKSEKVKWSVYIRHTTIVVNFQGQKLSQWEFRGDYPLTCRHIINEDTSLIILSEIT